MLNGMGGLEQVCPTAPVGIMAPLAASSMPIGCFFTCHWGLFQTHKLVLYRPSINRTDG